MNNFRFNTIDEAVEDIRKGKELGINDYQIKLDKEKLMNSVYGFLKKYTEKKR